MLRVKMVHENHISHIIESEWEEEWELTDLFSGDHLWSNLSHWSQLTLSSSLSYKVWSIGSSICMFQDEGLCVIHSRWPCFCVLVATVLTEPASQVTRVGIHSRWEKERAAKVLRRELRDRRIVYHEFDGVPNCIPRSQWKLNPSTCVSLRPIGFERKEEPKTPADCISLFSLLLLLLSFWSLAAWTSDMICLLLFSFLNFTHLVSFSWKWKRFCS